MRLIQFGDYVLPLWNKRDVVSMGDHGGATVNIVGGGAYDSYGSGASPEQALVLSTQFEIIATSASDVQKTRDEIRALAGTKARLWATFPDGSLRFAWARLARVQMERRYDFIHYQPVRLDFAVVTPGWRSGTPWDLDSGLMLDDGLLLDYIGDTWTPATSGESTIVPTFGNRMVTDAIVVITAGSAETITEIRLQCGACDWTWKSTIPLDGVLSINCGTKAVLLNGADSYDNLTLNAGHTVADWLQLLPGNNTVTITFTGNAGCTATVAFIYLDKYA